MRALDHVPVDHHAGDRRQQRHGVPGLARRQHGLDLLGLQPQQAQPVPRGGLQGGSLGREQLSLGSVDRWAVEGGQRLATADGFAGLVDVQSLDPGLGTERHVPESGCVPSDRAHGVDFDHEGPALDGGRAHAVPLPPDGIHEHGTALELPACDGREIHRTDGTGTRVCLLHARVHGAGPVRDLVVIPDAFAVVVRRFPGQGRAAGEHGRAHVGIRDLRGRLDPLPEARRHRAREAMEPALVVGVGGDHGDHGLTEGAEGPAGRVGIRGGPHLMRGLRGGQQRVGRGSCRVCGGCREGDLGVGGWGGEAVQVVVGQRRTELLVGCEAAIEGRCLGGRRDELATG